MPPHPGRIDPDPQGQFAPFSSLSSVAAERHNMGVYKFPSAGSHDVLVLLIAYADLALDTISTAPFYEDLFSGTAGGTGLTWQRYYSDMSNGSLILNFTVL